MAQDPDTHEPSASEIASVNHPGLKAEAWVEWPKQVDQAKR